MAVSPYFKTDPLIDKALEFIETTETARSADRPLDAVRGAISIAYRNAQVIEATEAENFQNGITASISAAESFISDTDPTVRAFARAEAERLVELRDDFLLNLSGSDSLTPIDANGVSSDRTGDQGDSLTASDIGDATVVGP